MSQSDFEKLVGEAAKLEASPSSDKCLHEAARAFWKALAAGYCRVLVRHAHEHLAKRHIPFSILFAYEPRIYEGSGYKLMQNVTRFIEPDGTPRTLVYRGSMYAELTDTRWPNQLLDLRGPTV